MEGRGSDVEYWRGETHLGSSLPLSVLRFPCPRVVSHVRTSLPTSARRCPCPCIVACVRTLLPMSTRRCPCPHVIACVRLRSWAWVVAFVGGRLFSFMGVGGSLCWWAVIFVCGQWQCGGGEPLVGGGESLGLALTCGSMAVVVALWCQAVRVVVVTSLSGCHVASCDVAPLVGVNEEAGRGVVLLTWAGHDMAAIIIIVVL